MRLPLYSDYVRQTVFMTTDEGSGLGFAVVRGSRLHRAIELKTAPSYHLNLTLFGWPCAYWRSCYPVFNSQDL
jgi:hypothetical protein